MNLGKLIRLELEFFSHDEEEFFNFATKKIFKSFSGPSKIVYDNERIFEQIVDEYNAKTEENLKDFYLFFEEDIDDLSKDIIYYNSTFSSKIISGNIYSNIKLNKKNSKTTNIFNNIKQNNLINKYFYISTLLNNLIKIFSLNNLKYLFINFFILDFFNAGNNRLFPKKRFIKAIFIMEIERAKFDKICYFIIIYDDIIPNKNNERKYYIKIDLD